MISKRAILTCHSTPRCKRRGAFRLALACLAMAVLVGAAGACTRARHNTVVCPKPEQYLFLSTAIRAANAYHAQHGHYADQWYLLDMTFAKGGYYVTDPDVRPTQADGSRWRPRGCKPTYVITRATPDTVLIQAVSDAGVVEYEITETMETPKDLLPPAVGPCASSWRT
jgi:hypothetical protein